MQNRKPHHNWREAFCKKKFEADLPEKGGSKGAVIL
jgi:hypothetical protein